MTKYNIHALCGHIVTVEIPGNKEEVQKKKKEIENSECSKCKNRTVLEEENTIKTVSYSEYKDIYIGCETVEGSYNDEDKTIDVCVPKNKRWR
ncbi:hypothetical protein [Methanimicrococcus blatticola]|uniref:Uncharacterized protein n=1 Tax=Methanimicrococcus blatticola TaxID=91560 RepID=A0A484F4A3_9EURY|nr:hypothetical protein [Methanimicrococcus blatticola]MBZ3935961.1 hypothetical protein [Methanimicrococcus blatticola]MCC2509426.1 hypothetical protein [Methanimicrococcus blatticola]TDQ68308.1 hypothetical protein C7391_1249 [Methanimicrococcus blatticola]